MLQTSANLCREHPVRLSTFLPSDNGLASEFNACTPLAAQLSVLASLPAGEFWSHALHNPTVGLFLDSFLRHRARAGDLAFSSLADSVFRDGVSEEALDSLVLEVLLRLSRAEAGAEALTRSALLAWPALVDACALYAGRAPDSARALVENTLRALPEMKAAFERDVAPLVVGALATAREARGKAAEDMPCLVGDLAWSAVALIDAWPDAAGALARCGLIDALADCYQVTLFSLEAAAIKAKDDAQVEFLARTRARVAYLATVTIRGAFQGLELLDVVDALLDKSEDAAGDHTRADIPASLVAACARGFGLRTDVSAARAVDDDRASYTLRILEELAKDVHPTPGAQRPQLSRSSAKPKPPPSAAAGSSSAPRVTDVEHSLISQVRDLLGPELGEGFILSCLRALNHNAETVIQHILEDTLPSPLKSMDRSAPLAALTTAAAASSSSSAASSSSSSSAAALASSALNSSAQPFTPSAYIPPSAFPEPLSGRRNVYDGDEFDIYANDKIDAKRVYLKGSLAPKDDGKIDLASVSVTARLLERMMYDDEFDDSLEDNNVRLGVDNKGNADDEEDPEETDDFKIAGNPNRMPPKPQPQQQQPQQQQQRPPKDKEPITKEQQQQQQQPEPKVEITDERAQRRKDRNKAAVANHHRKDRATRKQQMTGFL
jgi:hypothetical protein